MKESFYNYKKTIESNLSKFTYLYDGDVISSKILSKTSLLNNDGVSPKFIIECIDDIYRMSIDTMINNSIEHNIPMTLDHFKSDITKIISEIENLNFVKFKPYNIFISKNSFDIFSKLFNQKSNRPFPIHFYKLTEWIDRGLVLYHSPNIIDSNDELNIFITNKSIQSLVYTVQNMEYKVIVDNKEYKHVITYPFYNCDFICYKLVIKDIDKKRDDKINKILNED
jgi:hypothetical protein